MRSWNIQRIFIRGTGTKLSNDNIAVHSDIQEIDQAEHRLCMAIQRSIQVYSRAYMLHDFPAVFMQERD